MTAALDRRKVTADLMRALPDALAISSLGSATYDLAAATGDRARNFHFWGAMGGALPCALGLALARPQDRVLALLGDGELLMGMGALATVAQHDPANLAIIVLDNGRYGETGGQASHTALGADLTAIAKGCGITDSAAVATETELAAALKRIAAPAKGAAFLAIRVAAEELPRVLPPRDGVYLKERFRQALGLPPL